MAISSLVLPLSSKSSPISAFSFPNDDWLPTTIKTPFRVIDTPIRCAESNGSLRLAISPLVVALWPNQRRFPRFFNPMTIGRKLQLEHHSRLEIDLFDAGNALVISDWPYHLWLLRYGQNRLRFSRFFNGMMNWPKSCAECRTTVRLDLFDHAISMLPSILCQYDWLCCYSILLYGDTG